MPSGFLCGLKSARGRPAGIHVRKIERVELGPENVTFGAEGGVSQILLFARARVFDDPGKREISVFGGLRETAGEIVEAAGEPGVMFAEAIHSQDNQFLREQFGEGGSDGFEVRASGNEVNVSLDGETRCWKNAIAAEREFAG